MKNFTYYRNLTGVPEYQWYKNISYDGARLELGNLGMEDEPRGILDMVTLNSSSHPIVHMVGVINKYTPKYAAYRCEIWPCVKTYSATVHKSELFEKTVNEYLLTTPSGIYNSYQVADLTCVNSTGRDQLREMGYTANDGQRWTAWNTSLIYNITEQNPIPQYNGTCYNVPGEQLEKYCSEEIPGHWYLKQDYAQLFPPDCV